MSRAARSAASAVAAPGVAATASARDSKGDLAVEAERTTTADALTYARKLAQIWVGGITLNHNLQRIALLT